jgi:hypothetical protein
MKNIEAANFSAYANQSESCEADIGTVVSSKYPFLVNALTFPCPYLTVCMIGELQVSNF